MKSVSTKVLCGLLIIGLFSGIGAALAVTSWQQSISWEIKSGSFSIPNDQTINYGVVDQNQPLPITKQETYTVTNTGNIPIDVDASATCVGGCSASWDKTTAHIGIGDSATFTLTLTITGNGHCTVNFNKQ